MPLEFEIQSGGPRSSLEADEVVLRREVGRPLVWQCMVNVPNDAASPVALAEILESGGAQGTPVWVDPRSNSRERLWPEVPVTRADRRRVGERRRARPGAGGRPGGRGGAGR